MFHIWVDNDSKNNDTTMTLVNDKYSIQGMVRGLAASLTEDILRCYGNVIHSLLLQKNGNKCNNENERINNNDHYISYEIKWM